MANELSFGKVLLGKSTTEIVSDAPEKQGPFHLLILGDFTGQKYHQSPSETPWHQRKPIAVDRDNFDELAGSLNVHLDNLIAMPDGTSASLALKEFEDFEPDRLFQRLPLFDNLKSLRRRLQNPKHYEKAAAEVLSWLKPKETPAETSVNESASPDDNPLSTEGLFDQVLSGSEAAASTERADDWQSFIQQVLTESNIQKVDPRADDLIALVDRSIEEAMREILHAPPLKELESLWMGLHLLARRLETDSRLKIFILNVTEEEFRADLSVEELQHSQLHQLLHTATETPGAVRWSLAAPMYSFDTGAEDISILGRFTNVVAASYVAGIVGVNAAKKHWLSNEAEENPAWQQLRSLKGAPAVAAVWPRYLQRLPYGKKTRPTDQFDFEELSGYHHEHLAWGNPAWLACLELAGAFSKHRWSMNSGDIFEVDKLPLYYVDYEDVEVQPCGEYLLTDSELEKIIATGITPVVSFKNQDRIQLRGIQSVAGSNLRGRWNSE